MNWDDPEARLAYIEAHGPEAYNKALLAHHKNSTIETVNGYPIRPVMSRFGRLFMVDGTNSAFSTLEQAKEFARQQEAR